MKFTHMLEHEFKKYISVDGSIKLSKDKIVEQFLTDEDLLFQ